MPKPLPPPESLAGRAFTSMRAARLGVPYGRLRRRDLTTPSRGVRVPGGANPPIGQVMAVLREVSALCAASHTTGARLWDMRLPTRLLPDPWLHLSTPLGQGRLRRRGVVGHRQRLLPEEVVERDGIRLTSPARTCLDLEPLLSVTELVGSGSFPETLLRLALEDAGFSGLVLDLALRAPDGFPEVQPDIALPEHSLSVPFEGGHHDTAGQRVRDIERQRRTGSHGWREVRVTWADLHTAVAGPQGPEPRAVALVRRAIDDARRRRGHGCCRCGRAEASTAVPPRRRARRGQPTFVSGA
ncbi:hypothetical protein ACH9EU_10335 [Kocuria sp. M1R5S2]|uniref:hypothetical protein n=1 Tax=Kocuria rhizosphaerae TaxID=3376285 RepID=UPI0037A3AE79